MAIKDNIKNCCQAELIEKKPLDYIYACEFNLPKPISAVLKEFVNNDELNISANVTEFISLFMPTSDQIRDLTKFTEKQAKCHEQAYIGRVELLRQFFIACVLK